MSLVTAIVITTRRGCCRMVRAPRIAAQHICVTPTNYEMAGQMFVSLEMPGTLWSMDNCGEAS